MKAKYCKCKNTYTINNCDESNCSAFYYWYQGIGRITALPIDLSGIFDASFDDTFN